MGRTALLVLYGVPAVACAAWTVFAGKDVSWDLLNYHYYLPFELLAGRLEQDFFAASAQSYLNPIGYLPFYLMVSSGWHSVVVSVVLAVVHGLSVALLYLISWKLFAHRPTPERITLACLATALGISTSVFWATVGTSFIDPLLVPPMLAGLLLLMDGGERAARRAALAGALFGAAAALKYSNAIFVLAAFPLAIAMPAAVRLRACLGYVAGAAVAVGVLAGPWFVLLMREFGNPVFPLFNAWFQSPHAPAVNLVSERFTPKDFAAALTFPFRMVALDRSLYTETFAPDIRFAVLLVGAIALVLPVHRRTASIAGALCGTDWRVLGFFAASLLLWLTTSANARYGMVVLLLAGVCLTRVTERLLPIGAARIVLGALLAVQLGTTVMASPARWFIAEPWSRHWLPYAVPERALNEPALYLTVEVLPMAVLAPFMHPASSFANVRGQHSVPPDSPRLAALIEWHSGHARTLGRGLELVEGTPREDQRKVYDATLARIGFRVDVDDCFIIPWQSDDDDWLSRAANRWAGTQPVHEPLSVVSCGLLATARDPEGAEIEHRISTVFDRIEKSCPQLFHGQTAVTEPLGRGWSRNYGGLDARLELHDSRVFLNRYRTAMYVDLGRLADWEWVGADLPQACRDR